MLYTLFQHPETSMRYNLFDAKALIVCAVLRAVITIMPVLKVSQSHASSDKDRNIIILADHQITSSPKNLHISKATTVSM